MNVRSITYFLNPGFPLQPDKLDQAARFMERARPAFEAAGYVVETARLATIPFPYLLPELTKATLIDYAQTFETAARARGFDFVALGPALPPFPESYRLIPAALRHTESTFFSGLMAAPETGAVLPAVRACAEVMHQVATIDPKGFGNLFFTALANVPAGAPFFPAAYHEGNVPCFGLALEAADLAVDAVSRAGTLAQARQNLIDTVEHHAQMLGAVAERMQAESDISFRGLDFTLAPYPEDARSLGTAMESLGIPAVGLHGSLAAAAFLTDALDRAQYRRTGFNGLMLPMLEDSVLAQRGTEGILALEDLLLYSAVCGTGLDTIPLPGDTSPDVMAAILLDLAALAQRLEKPLTARLMPIPGKKAGDRTDFDFAFFANSHIVKVQARPLGGLMAGGESFQLKRRDWAAGR